MSLGGRIRPPRFKLSCGRSKHATATACSPTACSVARQRSGTPTRRAAAGRRRRSASIRSRRRVFASSPVTPRRRCRRSTCCIALRTAYSAIRWRMRRPCATGGSTTRSSAKPSFTSPQGPGGAAASETARAVLRLSDATQQRASAAGRTLGLRACLELSGHRYDLRPAKYGAPRALRGRAATCSPWTRSTCMASWCSTRLTAPGNEPRGHNRFAEGRGGR